MNDIKRVVSVQIFNERDVDNSISLASPFDDPFVVIGAAGTSNSAAHHRFNFRYKAAMPGCVFEIPIIPSEAANFHQEYSIKKIGAKSTSRIWRG